MRVLIFTAGETLPVFGTRRATHDFLRHGAFGGGWQIRESTAGELISLLMGHLADVEMPVAHTGCHIGFALWGGTGRDGCRMCWSAFVRPGGIL